MATRKLRQRFIVPVILILLFIVVSTLFVDFVSVIRYLSRADGRYLLAASFALMVGLVAYANRWRVLLSNKPTWLATFHAGNVGHMFNTLIPLRAGEPARIIVLSQNQKLPVAEVTASVVVELLIEQFMRLSAFMGALAFGVGLHTRAAGWGALFLLTAVTTLFLLVQQRQRVLAWGPIYLAKLPRVSETGARRLLANLLNGLAGVASPYQIGAALFWSLLVWGSFSIFHYLILLSLNLELLPGQAVAISLGALALAPPSAPTQPGVYHAFVIGSLVLAGFNLNTVTAYAIILHALEMGWMVTLGVWGLSQTGITFSELIPRTAAAPRRQHKESAREL